MHPDLSDCTRNDIQRNTQIIVKCCNCGKIKTAEGWITPVKARTLFGETLNQFSLNVSHGLCPACAAALYGTKHNSM